MKRFPDANLASLELHPFFHRAGRLDQPNAIVFDLDPGERIEAQNPTRVVSEMPESLRHGTIFIDWSQNSGFKTTIASVFAD